MLLIHLEVSMQGAASLLLAPHGQLSAEADMLLNVKVPVSMPTVPPLQAV